MVFFQRNLQPSNQGVQLMVIRAITFIVISNSVAILFELRACRSSISRTISYLYIQFTLNWKLTLLKKFFALLDRRGAKLFNEIP